MKMPAKGRDPICFPTKGDGDPVREWAEIEFMSDGLWDDTPNGALGPWTSRMTCGPIWWFPGFVEGGKTAFHWAGEKDTTMTWPT
jgi:hypothetical protein